MKTNPRFAALAATLALVPLCGSPAFAGENVMPLPVPAPSGPAALSYDISRAVAVGRTTSGGDTVPLQGEVVDNGNGSLTILLRNFQYGLGRGDGLSSRLNLRAVIPVETRAGYFPASLEAVTVLRLNKSAGSSVAAALDVFLLGSSSDENTVKWSAGDRVDGEVNLSNVAAFDDVAAKKEVFCAPGQGDGLLILNFALSAGRDADDVGGFNFRPADGEDLAIIVKPGVAKSCD